MGAPPRKLKRVLARAAAEVNHYFVVGKFEPRKDMLDGFGAVTAETVIEFGIPVGHQRRPLGGSIRGVRFAHKRTCGRARDQPKHSG